MQPPLMFRRPAPLTTSGVARALGVAERTVIRLVDRGVLPASRTESGVRLFDPIDVEAERLRREAAQRGTGGDAA